MCLIVETFTPYNKSNIRWKIFNKEKDGHYTSCFQRLFWWYDKKQKVIDLGWDWDVFHRKGDRFNSGGFHVLMSRKDARRTLKCLKIYSPYENCVIRKVRVNDFICGGPTYNVGVGLDGMRSEAWREVEILD